MPKRLYVPARPCKLILEQDDCTPTKAKHALDKMTELVKQYCIPEGEPMPWDVDDEGEPMPTGLSRDLDWLFTRPLHPPTEQKHDSQENLLNQIRLTWKSKFRIAGVDAKPSSRRWAQWTDVDLSNDTKKKASLKTIADKVKSTLAEAGELLLANFKDRFPNSGVYWGMELFSGASLTLAPDEVDERSTELHQVQVDEDAVDMPVFREQVCEVRRELKRLHQQAAMRSIKDTDERDMVPKGKRPSTPLPLRLWSHGAPCLVVSP